MRGSLGGCFDNNEGIVSVLKDRTGQGGIERVQEKPIMIGFDNKLLENVGDNDEEVGRQRVSLMQATRRAELVSRDTVDLDLVPHRSHTLHDKANPPMTEA